MNKLSEVIKFDPKEIKFSLQASTDAITTQTRVDELLAELSRGGRTQDWRAEHAMLAASIVPPIDSAIPYTRWTNMFFSPLSYADLEDNALPVEDIMTIAWKTHAMGQVLYTEPGYSWTRPEFSEWDTGIRIDWRTIRRAGWNVLERAMNRCTSDLARKIDAACKVVLDAAVIGAHATTCAGGKLTKASVDAVIKASQALGFPVTTAVINPGTLTDMTSWTGGVFTSGLSDAVSDEMVRTLHVASYGGVRFFSNVNMAAASVYFGGSPDQIGYEQTRGGMETHSDVDITQKYDLHTIMTQEYAWYVGSAYPIWTITITA